MAGGEKMQNINLENCINGLVEVQKIYDHLAVDIKYAGKDNFIGRAVYPSNKLILRYETAIKLINANKEFEKHGYRLKVYDGYRPIAVQKIMWDIFEDENFVAPVSRGSVHNRGAAVDVTLVDKFDNEVKMPSAFDEFSEKASIYYKHSTQEEKENMEFLAEIMERNGFDRIDSEWWHFNDCNYRLYPILDVDMNCFGELAEGKGSHLK
jgi:zinc D-Ala-D-Ala dipeptidase